MRIFKRLSLVIAVVSVLLPAFVIPASADDNLSEQDWCAEEGGIWDEDYGCYWDDGSIWSARDEGSCLERGGAWASEGDYGYCYEDCLL